jgi:hypothetical protein
MTNETTVTVDEIRKRISNLAMQKRRAVKCGFRMQPLLQRLSIIGPPLPTLLRP